MITPSLNIKALLLLLAMTAVLIAASPVKAAVMVLLTIHALRGPRQVIEAFTVGIFLTICNPELGGGSAALRWPLLFAGFGRIVWDLTRHRHALSDSVVVLFVFLYAASAIFFAPFVSEYVDISVLKATTFFIGAFTIINAFRLTANQQKYWYSWFTTFYTYIVVGSIPMLYLPGSYLGGLFKGLFNHPQAFGAFLISFTAWLLFVLIRAERRPAWLVGTTLLGLFWVYQTGSRTAMLAIVLAVGLTGLVTLLRGGAWRSIVLSGARRIAIPVVLFAVVIGVFKGQQIAEGVQAFMAKGKTEVDSYGAAFEESRGFLIDRQMENFRSSPLIGIGFAAPSLEGDLTIKRSGFLNLPTGASIEKGFLPSAVLEEMGIVGAGLMLLLISALLFAVWRQPDPSLMALLLAALLINAGEMIFFSPMALGVFMWLSFGLAITQYEASTDVRYAHRVAYRKPSPALGRLENAV